LQGQFKRTILLQQRFSQENRNFEGRVNPYTHLNYLASPPLVVAYALAGTMDINFGKDPIGAGKDGEPVFLKDIWPSPQEIEQTMLQSVKTGDVQAGIFQCPLKATKAGNIPTSTGVQYPWEAGLDIYQGSAVFLRIFQNEPQPLQDIHNARYLP